MKKLIPIILLLIINSYFCYQTINIIPIINIVVSLISIILIILIYKNKKWAIVLSIILDILLIIISFFYADIKNILSDLTPDEIKYTDYYIISNKDIENIDNELIMAYNDQTDGYKSACKDLNIKEDNDIYNLITNIISGEYKLGLISSSMYDTLEETKQKLVIIKTITVKITSNIETPKLDMTADPFTIYLSGKDAGYKTLTMGRSDVNIIIKVDPKTNKILIINIPRDYYITLAGINKKDKLTHAGIYGIDMSIKTIENLLNTKLDYYYAFSFDTLTNFVNQIDGVDIYVDQDISLWTDHGKTISKGNQHLNGEYALAYARERHSYETGDRHRGENQMQIIEAMIQKVENNPKYLLKYRELLKTVTKYGETNIDMKNIEKLLQKQIISNPKWTIEQYSLNGTGESNYTYSGGSRKLYVMDIDYSTVNHATELLKNI